MRETPAERLAAWWQKILGFVPEKTFQSDDGGKCFNCNSKNIEHLNAPPWLGKMKCNDCGYYTYKSYQDKMGTVAQDDVACDKRDSTMIPSKSSTET